MKIFRLQRNTRVPAIVCRVLCVCVLAAGGGSFQGVHAGVQQPADDRIRSVLIEAVQEDIFADRFEGQVWLMDMANRLAKRVPDPDQRVELLKLVYLEAGRADLPPELVLAVIDVESNFDRFAISSAGARGLMQVMPFWLKEIGRPNDNLFEVSTNLRFGCTILRHYLEIEKGNVQRALARYNGSLGKLWYPNRVMRALHRRWFKQ